VGYAPQVDTDKLGIGGGEDTKLAAAGSLRPGRNGGNLLAEQGIDQGGLAHVGFTKDGNKAGMEISHI
jgi:hypothetical protein